MLIMDSFEVENKSRNKKPRPMTSGASLGKWRVDAQKDSAKLLGEYRDNHRV